MTTTYNRTLELVDIACCSCGIVFGLNGDYYNARKNDGAYWYCPNGHQQHFSETTAKRLQREKETLERKLANSQEDARSARAAREVERRSHAATKGQLTKVKKRAAAGVCPCCQRSFAEVARHMATKHPNYKPAS